MVLLYSKIAQRIMKGNPGLRTKRAGNNNRASRIVEYTQLDAGQSGAKSCWNTQRFRECLCVLFPEFASYAIQCRCLLSVRTYIIFTRNVNHVIFRPPVELTSHATFTADMIGQRKHQPGVHLTSSDGHNFSVDCAIRGAAEYAPF